MLSFYETADHYVVTETIHNIATTKKTVVKYTKDLKFKSCNNEPDFPMNKSDVDLFNKYYIKEFKKKTKIYQTNSGLGYNEFAYFIILKQNGKDLVGLCIGMNYIKFYGYNDMYTIGNTNVFEKYELENSSYKIEESELYNTFLFNHLLKTINYI